MQRLQQAVARHPVLTTGVLDGVEDRDRTADAIHPEIEERANRRRPSAHHVVDVACKLDRRVFA